MNTAREELFPRSRLADEKNCDTATRGNLRRKRDHFAYDETVTNNVRMPPICGGIRGPRWNKYSVPFADETAKRPRSGVKKRSCENCEKGGSESDSGRLQSDEETLA